MAGRHFRSRSFQKSGSSYRRVANLAKLQIYGTTPNWTTCNCVDSWKRRRKVCDCSVHRGATNSSNVQFPVSLFDFWSPNSVQCFCSTTMGFPTLPSNMLKYSCALFPVLIDPAKDDVSHIFCSLKTSKGCPLHFFCSTYFFPIVVHGTYVRTSLPNV